MSERKFKKLRQQATKETIGQPEMITKKRYRQLKADARAKPPLKVKPRQSKRQTRIAAIK